jgi:hypothetical protein
VLPEGFDLRARPEDDVAFGADVSRLLREETERFIRTVDHYQVTEERDPSEAVVLEVTEEGAAMRRMAEAVVLDHTLQVNAAQRVFRQQLEHLLAILFGQLTHRTPIHLTRHRALRLAMC